MLLKKLKKSVSLVAENDFNHTQARAIQTQLTELMGASSTLPVTLGFGAADTLDGAGLKLVIGLAKSCIQQNRKLTIQTSNPGLRASLQFCGLDTLIDMQEA